MKKIQQLVRLANRVHVSIHDIGEAKAFAETYKNLRQSQLQVQLAADMRQLEAGLGMAAVVSYARPFVGSRSGGVADKSLDPKALELFDNHPELAVEHDLVLMLRHKVVAHSEWQHRFSLVGESSEAERERFLVVFDSTRLLTNFHSFLDLCNHVQGRLFRLLNRCEAEISALSDGAE
jgi:hypothetical protein